MGSGPSSSGKAGGGATITKPLWPHKSVTSVICRVCAERMGTEDGVNPGRVSYLRKALGQAPGYPGLGAFHRCLGGPPRTHLLC